ncbi:MAG: class I SAM-dependent methyltransferase [Planctomycetota bacterium]|jgi:predicted SAM-dependent methyltransferase
MKSKILLNIGCGSKRYPGFINVDAVDAPHVDYVTDNLKKMPFDSNYADLVYMCHVLEHIKREDLPVVMAEMHRILKSGGIFRVSVPGFDELVAFYNNSERDISSIELQLMGGQNHEYNFHYSVFNDERLTDLMGKAGFNTVYTWDPDNCEYHNFRDRASREISLNIEGLK